MITVRRCKPYLKAKGSDFLKIQNSFSEQQPSLYLVPTPIGNIQDITYRAIDILNEVAVIYAEDTRHSGALLKHYNIKTPMISLHQHNESARISTILEKLHEGKSIALISDAGTPLMSDPGEQLVAKLTAEGIPVIALPGATAIMPALTASGLPAHPYLFYGFLPTKQTQKLKVLKKLQSYSETLVFYEAPHRILDTLETIYKIFGNRKAVLARELTKRFETFYRFSLEDYALLDHLKGEMVLIIEGSPEEIVVTDGDVVEHIELMIADGYREMEAIKHVAKSRKIPKNDAYMAFQKYKKTQEGKE